MLYLIFYNSDAEHESEVEWADIDREMNFPHGYSSRRWKVVCKGFGYDESFNERLDVRHV